MSRDPIAAANPLVAPENTAGPPRMAALLCVAAGAGCSGLGFTPALPARSVQVVAVVCALLPVLLSAGLRRLNARGVVVAVASGAGWLATVLVLPALAGAHGAGDLGAVGDGLLNGTARLLVSSGRDAGHPELLVTPAALVWLAAALGAELSHRTSAGVLPLIPALAVAAGTTALALPADPCHVYVAAGQVAVTAIHLLTRRPRAAGRSRAGTGSGRGVRVPLAGVLTVAALVTATWQAGVSEPAKALGDRAVDPRDHVQRSDPLDGTDPLALVAKWRANPDEVVFDARGGDTHLWWRLAVLHTYDGGTWLTHAKGVPPSAWRLDQADGTLPPPGRTPARLSTGTVHQDVVPVDLPGPYLPSYDWPVRANGTGLLVDLNTGTLASQAGAEYQVDSLPSWAARAGLVPAGGATLAAHLAVPPELAAALKAWIEARHLRRSSELAMAAAVALAVDPYGNYDRNAAPGCTPSMIRGFLAGATTDSGHPLPASDELLATVFVLAARELGVKARLVIGFTPRVGPVPAGAVRVWAEAYVPTVGWLPFIQMADPDSRSEAAASGQALRDLEAAGGGAGATSPGGSTGDGGTSGPGGGHTSAPTVPPPPPTSHSFRVLAERAAVLALVLLLLALLVAVALAARGLWARWRRHVARTRGPSATRVVAAWHDTLGLMRANQWPLRADMTGADVVDMTRRRAGPEMTEPLAELADAAARVLYDPRARAGAQDADAQAAWALRDRCIAALPRTSVVARKGPVVAGAPTGGGENRADGQRPST